MDPRAHITMTPDSPVSAPSAARYGIDPVQTAQVFAMHHYDYPDGGRIDRVVVEFSLRVLVHDPGGDSPIVTHVFSTANGDRFLTIPLRQNSVAAATSFGANWTFPQALLDGKWHSFRVVIQREDGGFGTAITVDGLLVTATVGDAGSVSPVSPFQDPVRIELGMHGFMGTGARQIDLDNVVISH